jgi:SAM-dependent methyltransferase
LKLRAARKQAARLQRIATTFEEVELPVEVHMYRRAKPKPYMEAALALFRAIGGETIVEIGCMRDPLEHPIDVIQPYCCNDGHSTYFWALSGAQVFSVDSDPQAVAIARSSCKGFPNVHIEQGDGIRFLQAFDRPIDLLYLDAWDVIAGSRYAENHLSAFQKAQRNLQAQHIVAIDDTDLGGGGKGRLLVPQLEKLGYEILARGRQTIAFFDQNPSNEKQGC